MTPATTHAIVETVELAVSVRTIGTTRAMATTAKTIHPHEVMSDRNLPRSRPNEVADVTAKDLPRRAIHRT
jgi:hypothetical protein